MSPVKMIDMSANLMKEKSSLKVLHTVALATHDQNKRISSLEHRLTFAHSYVGKMQAVY